MPKNTMYKVGQKLRFIGKTLPGSVWTQGKIYEIHSISDEFINIEYYIIRDDGKMGLWWEYEIKNKFICIKEERKKKLKKLSNLN